MVEPSLYQKGPNPSGVNAMYDIPLTMTAALISTPGIFPKQMGGISVVHDAAVPEIGADDVLVEVHYNSVCHTDHTQLSGFFVNKNGSPLENQIFGHEAAGRIVAKGKDVGQVEVGDFVLVPPTRGCLECDNCLDGYDNNCTTPSGVIGITGKSIGGNFVGVTEQGTYAEYKAMPAWAVAKIDRPDLSLKYLSGFTDRGAVTAYSVDQVNWREGNNAGVWGLGSAGLMTIINLMAKGVEPDHIYGIDTKDEALEAAHELGVPKENLFNVMTDEHAKNGMMFSYFKKNDIDIKASFDCVGAFTTYSDAFMSTRHGGNVFEIGFTPDRAFTGERAAANQILQTVIERKDEEGFMEQLATELEAGRGPLLKDITGPALRLIKSYVNPGSYMGEGETINGEWSYPTLYLQTLVKLLADKDAYPTHLLEQVVVPTQYALVPGDGEKSLEDALEAMHNRQLVGTASVRIVTPEHASLN